MNQTIIKIKGQNYKFEYVEAAWKQSHDIALALFKDKQEFRYNLGIMAIFYSLQALNQSTFKFSMKEFYSLYYDDIEIGMKALHCLIGCHKNPLLN